MHSPFPPGKPDPAGELPPGTQIGSDFVLEQYIAAGGMGFIYRADQRSTGETVAIKIMRDQLRRDESAVKRFEREAQTISQLHHPNTITLLDWGHTDDDLLYIAMEWLDGCDLADYLDQYGVIAPPRVAFIGGAVARALAEAHDKGIIHRDLKPENVFFVRTDDGRDLIKVLDFGIAKIVGGPPATQITRIGMVCGTPDFMSPEQGRGEDLDGRSDVYALGCMLYTLLVGQTPFPAETPLKIVMRHQLEPFPHLPTHLPKELDDILQRACSKDRDDRFPHATALAEALEGYVAKSNEVFHAARGTGIMPAFNPEELEDYRPPEVDQDTGPTPATPDTGSNAPFIAGDADADALEELANRPTQLHQFDLGSNQTGGQSSSVQPGGAQASAASANAGGAPTGNPNAQAQGAAGTQQGAAPHARRAKAPTPRRTQMMPQSQSTSGTSPKTIAFLVILILATIGVAIAAVLLI